MFLQGFPSKVRDAEEGLQDSAESVQERKQQELQRSLWDLGLAWGLVLICCTHHLGHWLHGLGWHGKALSALHPSVCHVFHFEQAHSGPGPCAASDFGHWLHGLALAWYAPVAVPQHVHHAMRPASQCESWGLMWAPIHQAIPPYVLEGLLKAWLPP